jgi:integrase
VNNPAAARAGRPRLEVVAGEAAALDGEWASDHWQARRLGIPARRGRATARFDGISQPWLRDPVKRWSRLRLATGCAFTTIGSGALALTRFSGFLAACHPEADRPGAITRPVLEDYLSWLVTQGYSAATRALSLSMIRVFFEACHRHGWLPGLAASATIYVEELPFHHDEIARFIPEYVMAQLESDEAIAKIPHLTTRHLILVMIETGLRGGDACTLPFNPVLTDSSGWPCLRFEAVKVRAEQLIPLSARAAAAIRAQQDYVCQRWPAGSPWLFPGIAGNHDGQRPYSHSSFSQQLRRWQRVIGLRDEAGQPVTVTGHQFRHTLGTRLINSGVPQLFPVTQDDDVAVIDDEDVGEVDGPAGWVLAGPWCACWRGAGQSVVTSVTAARALCSSTMFLRPAMAATRAWVARLLTARGRPRAASWIKVVASLLNRGSARPASLRWWVMYPAVCSAVMAGMA